MFDMLTKTYSKVIGYQFAPIIVILIFKQKRVEIFCYRGKSVRVKELTTELGRVDLRDNDPGVKSSLSTPG